jgi:hypothetical protein
MTTRPDRLVQIVPRLGPFDGVGDYALRIGEELRRGSAIVSSFIEAGRWRPTAVIEPGFDYVRCQSRSATSFADALSKCGVTRGEATAVLLHYVGYGYAKRGAPIWLTRAITLSQSSLQYRLGVVFHELYATGKPWQSSYWLSGVQKLLAARLARQCDGALLTREGNRQWLARAGALAGKALIVLPVPSTVGEPDDVLPFMRRDPTLVVWGSAAVKREVYGRYWPRVLSYCRRLGIICIADVGASGDKYPDDSTIRVDKHGLLPAAAMSRILGGSRFGMVVYPASFLAKSSIFAACAAHGVVPLVLDDSGSDAADGLVAGTHFSQLAVTAKPEDSLEDIAGAARVWYSGHRVAHHAAAIRTLFQGASA